MEYISCIRQRSTRESRRTLCESMVTGRRTPVSCTMHCHHSGWMTCLRIWRKWHARSEPRRRRGRRKLCECRSCITYCGCICIVITVSVWHGDGESAESYVVAHVLSLQRSTRWWRRRRRELWHCHHSGCMTWWRRRRRVQRCCHHSGCMTWRRRRRRELCVCTCTVITLGVWHGDGEGAEGCVKEVLLVVLVMGTRGQNSRL